MNANLLPAPERAGPAPAPAEAARLPRLGALDALAALAVLAALYAAFVVSPAERVQGDVFRILYVHVAMAWLAYAAFFVVLVGSAAYLWRRSQPLDDVAHAAAEVGVVFTTLTLVTGSIWGRAVWNVWWTWDARLTTTLVLWFIYVGYLMVRSAVAEPERGARIAAVVGVFGFVGVVVNYASVTLWRTLHPTPTVASPGGMAPVMYLVLVVSLAAFSLVFARLMVLRVGIIRARCRIDDLTQRIADHLEA